MYRTPPPGRLALAVLCAVVIAGCGNGSTPAQHNATATPAPATAQVRMKNIRFLPHTITIDLDQTIRWTNDDRVAHTVASQALHLSSEAIEPGRTFTYRPPSPGRYPYFCTIHFGQTGTIVVRAARRGY